MSHTLKEGSILKEYIQFHNKYTTIYGENSVVLMQVGQFFEMYAVTNETIHMGADLTKLSDILQIQVARRDKEIDQISCDNYLMAGFPDHSLLKFKNILLNHNFTIILVEQVTEPPNPERKVTEIISPGTSLDPFNKADTHYLLSIYIDSYPSHTHQIHIAGLSAINIATGKNYVHTIVSTVDDKNLWKDEIYRFIHYYNPSEILIHYSSAVTMSTKDISHYWDIEESIIHNNIIHSKEYHKLSYQNKCLSKYFTPHNMLSPIEYLGFERYPEITISYLYLLQFIYEHKVTLSYELSKPQFINDSHHLILSNNCIQQLNVIDNNHQYTGKYDSLLSIVNKCHTAIGRRHCKDRILYPIINPDILQERYNHIETLQTIQDNQPIYETCRTHLRKIIDIERLHRKMSLQLLHPYEFHSLLTSYQYILKIKEHLATYSLLTPYLDHFQKLEQLLTLVQEQFMMSEIEKYQQHNIESSLFQIGIYPDIDEIYQRILTHKQHLSSCCEYLSIFIDKKVKNPIKICCNDRYGWHLYLTKNRSKLLHKHIHNLSDPIISIKDTHKTILYQFHRDDVQFKTYNGSNVILSLPFINELSTHIIQDTRLLSSLNKEKYLEHIKSIYQDYKMNIHSVADFVGFIDVSSTIAAISIQYNYCQPKINNSHNHESYINAKQLRHPIVEKIQEDLEYIPNDISLCNDGMLLYGTNACGKSTLMKSVGLSIILAQAGFYVPCESFEYYPYHHLFTRILNNDNMFRGQSSFAVEMSELRSIFKRANQHSLILGDELCSGTENVSALSIVATGLLRLSDMKSSFIFTSHLHTLMEIPLVKNIPNLHVYHLKIKFDEINDVLLYDRTLEKGSGPAVYGLEVCKAMDLGNDFISQAKQIQLQLLGKSNEIISTKQSNYHKDVYMHKCEVCNKPAEHTHHINEQHNADQHGMLQHYHKNSKFNLIPLCESCHHDVHNNKILIHGYQMTTKGIQLNIEKDISIQTSSTKKFSKEQVSLIQSFQPHIESKQITKTKLLTKLELEHSIKISSGTLTKILTNVY